MKRSPSSPLSRPSLGRSLRFWGAVGVTVPAAVLFVMPRYSLPDPGTTLIWGLPSGPTVHVLICAAIGLVWTLALPGVRTPRLLLGGVLFAVGAEILQLLPFVDRGVNWEDLGFNVLGVGLGGLLSGRWRCSGSRYRGEGARSRSNR